MPLLPLSSVTYPVEEMPLVSRPALLLLPDPPLVIVVLWEICAALPVDLRAVPLYSLLSVALPALPSAVRLLFFWKAITAACVATPKVPSTFPLR